MEKCTGKKYCDCAREAMKRGANRDWVDGLEDECPFRVKETPKEQPVKTSDPLSVRADAVYNKRKQEDERNFERVKEMLPKVSESETDRRLFQNLPDNGLRELKCKGAELENT